MKVVAPLFLRFVVVAAIAVCVDAMSTTEIPAVYEAIINELGGSGVTGTAMVFSDGSSPGVVGYAGYGMGLAPQLAAVNCTAKNGCGAHIHNGTGCTSKEEQGEHYYIVGDDSSGITVDPWLVERYTSDANGRASYAGVLDIGTNDMEGRTFLLHNATGSRIGCGVLKRVRDSALLVAYGEVDGSVGLAEINDSQVAGSVVVYQPNDDVVCHFGTGSGLTPNVISFLVDRGSTQCTNANGCGAHIHAGTSCADTTSQGGHYYDAVEVAEDPWKYAGYHTTNGHGDAYYTGCLETGETVFENKAFVLHGETGGRVACGLLRPISSPANSCPDVCASELGVGYHMHRPTPAVWRALNQLFGRGKSAAQPSCQAMCIPDYAVEISKTTFGFSCGICPSPYKSE